MDRTFNSKAYSKDFNINKVDKIRISKILRLIGSEKKVLDIGCGDGFIMERIRNVGNYVEGIEVAEEAIKKAREKGFKVYDIDLNSDFASYIKTKYEVVFAGEIIEHIFDTDKFLRNIRKLLKKNGELIVTTPNIASLGRRIILLLGRDPLIEVTARVNNVGHIRYFTQKSLSRLLEDNKYKVEIIESGVVNFDIQGKFHSKILATLFPRFGNVIISKAIKF